MKILKEKMQNIIYNIYAMYPIFVLVNFFRYFGTKISVKAFVFSQKIDNSCRIGGGVFIDKNSSIGFGTYVSGDLFGMNCSKILYTKIGKYCSIASNFITLPLGHDYNSISTYPFGSFYQGFASNITFKPITIGNDVWIGSGVTILGGVAIEDGVIVGAGAVVTKSIPAYAIVAGNPARVIKYRFEEQKIKELKSIDWWNFSEEEVLKFIKSQKEFNN